jgi:hypothetical protein
MSINLCPEAIRENNLKRVIIPRKTGTRKAAISFLETDKGRDVEDKTRKERGRIQKEFRRRKWR